MLVGERLAEGATLYVGLWEGIAPLSAWLYMVIHFLFGKSLWAYHIIALLIAFLQCVIFNNVTRNNRAYIDNNYLPAAIYGILISISYDMYTLTPVLMSTTFILLALNNIFSQVEFRMKKDERILSIGIYIGMAALFYLPAAIFSVITILALAIFSSTIGRRYLLILYGFILPCFIIGLYYFVIGELGSLFRIFSYKAASPDRIQYLDLTSTAVLLAVPLFFLLMAIIRILKRSRFSNYQVRLIQLVLLWMFTSIPVLLWSDRTVINFMLFLPGAAFLITHYFNLMRGRVASELTFTVMTIGIIMISLSSYCGWFGIDRFVNYNKMNVVGTQYDELVKDKKILVIGDDVNIYKESSLATPFLDWPLSEQVLTQPDYYDNISLIFQVFKSDKPEVVIDLENALPAIMKRIPLIEDSYKLTEPNVYVLK